MRLGKIKIHPSFLVLFLLVVISGKLRQFFLVVLAVTAHELTHAATARMFGLKTESVLLTPAGESAQILGFERLTAPKKYAVLLAGPAFNILAALVIKFFFIQAAEAEEFMYINLAIGVFNLLPFYPMDGGRVLHVFLGNRLGILTAAVCVRQASYAGTAIIVATGVLQLILFPFNMSLLAVGIFLAVIAKRERAALVFSYYSCMLSKRGPRAAKTAIFPGESVAWDVERHFTWDYFHIIYVLGENGEIAGILSEKCIFEAISTRATGENIKLLDIIENNVIIESEEMEKEQTFENK